MNERLLDAYMRTSWRLPHAPDEVRIGAIEPAASLLADASAGTAAIITAWNPESRPLDGEENRRRNDELAKALAGWRWKHCVGHATDGSDWSEDSFVVYDIDFADAVRLGEAFGQNTIVWWRRGEAPSLVVTRDGFAGLSLGSVVSQD
jgi:hypothetical protein